MGLSWGLSLKFPTRPRSSAPRVSFRCRVRSCRHAAKGYTLFRDTPDFSACDSFGGGRRLLLGEPSANTPYPLARTCAPPPHFLPQHAPSLNNHSSTTLQPTSTPTTAQSSFVSNPRTISTQPSFIRDSPTPTASSTTTQRWLKFWYNISAFSEEDVGLKNRAGGPSEMMLI